MMCREEWLLYTIKNYNFYSCTFVFSNELKPRHFWINLSFTCFNKMSQKSDKSIHDQENLARSTAYNYT